MSINAKPIQYFNHFNKLADEWDDLEVQTILRDGANQMLQLIAPEAGRKEAGSK